MNIDELSKRLDKEFPSVYKTILVSGDWGIGKTYLIKNKYIKEKKSNIIYASIFGLNSISELNLYILNEMNKVLGLFKKGYDIFSGKDLGILSVSLQLPEFKIESSSIIKRKSKKDKIKIIIDDIERKSRNIDMNELMGFFETLSNIENVELILIANTEKFSDEDKENFENFKEKLIEKEYKVDSYSSIAEKAIISQNLNINLDILQIVENYFKKCNVNNLRTLKKCIDFIKQNNNYINLGDLNHEQIKDIVELEICIVIEKLEKNYLQETQEKERIIPIYNDKIVPYINNKYFKNANPYYKNRIISHLAKIYDDIEIEENAKSINCIYDEINNPQIESIEKIDPFYLSKEQLKQRIQIFNNTYMNKISDNLDIYSWFKKLSYLYSYAEKVSLQQNLSDEDILNTIDLYIKNIDTSQHIQTMHTHLWDSDLKTEEMKKYYTIIQDKILYGYYEKLFKELKNDFYSNNYDEDKYSKLINILNEKEDVIINIKKALYQEEFFIPNLNEELNEKIWGYTHNIWNKMQFIDDKSDFIKVVRKRLDDASELGKYRLESLNKYYHIICN